MQPPLDRGTDDFDRRNMDDDCQEAPEPLFRWQSPRMIILLAFIVTRLWMTAFGYVGMASDIEYYGNYAQQGIDVGKAVYSDFELEYPPLAWWLIAMPRALDSRTYWETAPPQEVVKAFFAWYCPIFHLELFVADVVCLVFMFAIGGVMLPRAQWRLAAMYTLLPMPQPHILYDRLDLVLLMFLLLTIYCWLRSLEALPASNNWGMASYWFLGLGISYKIVPIFLVPFLLLADLRALGSARKIAARIALLLVAGAGPFLLYLPSAGWGVFALFKYHGDRGIHVESIWSSLVLAARPFGAVCQTYYDYGGFNLASAWSNELKTISSVAIPATAATLGLWALLRGKRFDRRLALDSAQLALINATIFSHVYSPQYLTWLVPLSVILALNIFPRSRVLWSVFAALAVAILGISGWLFPYHYAALTALESLPVALSVTRSACLAGLALSLNVCFFARYGLNPWPASKETAASLAVAT